MKRPQIMAILNITPDSFSDGGHYEQTEHAVNHAKDCIADGADILDIGAESTRPGATPVSAEEEIARLTTVLKRLQSEVNAKLSIDTYKAEVARFGTKHGAAIINDVWGLQKDHEMAAAVAESDAGVIIMHNRLDGVDENIDILDDMDRWFDHSLKIAKNHGISQNKIILDPGIGFGKSFRQNLIVLAHLDRLKERGYPLLMGLSRKRFIGAILENDVDQRLFGTLSANLFSILSGVDIIRVHDVKPHQEAIDVLMAIDAERASVQ